MLDEKAFSEASLCFCFMFTAEAESPSAFLFILVSNHWSGWTFQTVIRSLCRWNQILILYHKFWRCTPHIHFLCLLCSQFCSYTFQILKYLIGLCYKRSSAPCCDWKARAASAQSFTLWQQVTVKITCHDHSIIACSCHVYMSVILGHIPFVVNRTFNATPPERLRQSVA